MKTKILYTDNLPVGTGGRCTYPILPLFFTCTIRIRNKYRDDKGLLNHELKHAEQYSNNFFHTLLVKFSGNYRYKIELEAYTEQIIEYGYTHIKEADWIVRALLDKYHTGKDYTEIHKDLTNIITLKNN